MDLKKTGLFIAALRRERNLTQKELAEKSGLQIKPYPDGRQVRDFRRFPFCRDWRRCCRCLSRN